jgi:hypothetical protein
MDIVPIRTEVIEARRSRKAGAIVLARPVPMKVAAACGAAVKVSRVTQMPGGTARPWEAGASTGCRGSVPEFTP